MLSVVQVKENQNLVQDVCNNYEAHGISSRMEAICTVLFSAGSIFVCRPPMTLTRHCTIVILCWMLISARSMEKVVSREYSYYWEAIRTWMRKIAMKRLARGLKAFVSMLIVSVTWILACTHVGMHMQVSNLVTVWNGMYIFRCHYYN